MIMSSQESSTMQIDDSSNPYLIDELTTSDELTTDEILMKIEYNTRMTSIGVSHIFSKYDPYRKTSNKNQTNRKYMRNTN